MAGKAKKNNKYVEQLTQGWRDMQVVLQEGNFKLFVKQVIVIAVAVFIWNQATGKFTAKIQNLNGQMDAIKAQQINEGEYMSNKKLLISLEPRFASIESKNEWLLRQILDIFQKAQLSPNVSGSQVEDSSNPTYLVASMQVGSTMEYKTFAELLASIENRKEYIKISNFVLEKNKDPNQMGVNKISLKLNTIFPKEKVAKQLFKDYDQLVAEQHKEKAAKKKRKVK